MFFFQGQYRRVCCGEDGEIIQLQVLARAGNAQREDEEFSQQREEHMLHRRAERG